ncbi:MAG: cytochrome c biogenesis CcdA family protein [Lachnospiraceae bacterium]|nr:cytochrome c biogenesis CcdA family protein [Lachnospiraceae bacterium]
MQYIITFLEGVITFISPCLLPMLPIYVSYFTGRSDDRKGTLKHALSFVLGFTVVFVVLGAFAGTLGLALREHSTAVNLITGAIVIIFGLNFMGLINISFLNMTKKLDQDISGKSAFSTFLFGMVFSIGWTPCVGAFLGSALMMASGSGSSLEGILLLLAYSAGLGIPFLISALLIERLKETFIQIKKHYALINKISGIFLILMGLLMMTGLMSKLMNFFSF